LKAAVISRKAMPMSNRISIAMNRKWPAPATARIVVHVLVAADAPVAAVGVAAGVVDEAVLADMAEDTAVRAANLLVTMPVAGRL
jgi:hypothetical protein